MSIKFKIIFILFIILIINIPTGIISIMSINNFSENFFEIKHRLEQEREALGFLKEGEISAFFSVIHFSEQIKSEDIDFHKGKYMIDLENKIKAGKNIYSNTQKNEIENKIWNRIISRLEEVKKSESKLKMNKIKIEELLKAGFTEKDSIYKDIEQEQLEIGESILKSFFENNIDINKLIEANNLKIIAKENEAQLKSRKQVRFIIYSLFTSFIFSVILSLRFGYIFSKKINIVIENFRKVFSGDLTVRTTLKSKDEIGILSMEFNNFLEKLQKMIIAISSIMNKAKENSKEISSFMKQISFGADKQFQNSENLFQGITDIEIGMKKITESVEMQISSFEETSRSITEVLKTINFMTENSMNTVKLSEETTKGAISGGKITKDAFLEMKKIEKNVKNIEDKIINLEGNTVKEIERKALKLGESSEEIGEILKVIENIAEQTNLLALNAAIEAAHAGDAGKGFAVVADQIKLLAESSHKSTKEIEKLISTIHTDIREVIKSTKKGYEEVKEVLNEAKKGYEESVKGMDLSMEAENKLKEIIKMADSTNKEVKNMSNAIGEQSKSMEEISVATQNVENQSIMIKDSTENQSNILQDFSLSVQDVVKLASESSKLSDIAIESSKSLLEIVKNLEIMLNEFKTK